jgi:plastocyanin
MRHGGNLLASVSAVLLVQSLSAAGVAPSPAVPGAKAQSHVVTIEGVQFHPATLRVHRGDTIVWINKDLFPHTVTAAAKAFDSHDIAPNASWTYRAVKAGNYAYTCTYHPTMKGQLSVQ